MRSPGINGEGELRGQQANPGSPGKMAVKTECVCVWLTQKEERKERCVCVCSQYRSKFTTEETVMFCLRVMVGVIILYDHVHPVGAFAKTSPIDVRQSVSQSVVPHCWLSVCVLACLLCLGRWQSHTLSVWLSAVLRWFMLILRLCAGSGVVRIDALHFLAGCHKRQLNQALSVLSLSLGFFLVCMLCC